MTEQVDMQSEDASPFGKAGKDELDGVLRHWRAIHAPEELIVEQGLWPEIVEVLLEQL